MGISNQINRVLNRVSMSDLAFEIYQSVVNLEYHFRLVGPNKRVVFTSIGYKQRADCRHRIEEVKANAVSWRRLTELSEHGDYSFQILAANGEHLGRGEGYPTAAARAQGMSAAQLYARLAEIKEMD